MAIHVFLEAGFQRFEELLGLIRCQLFLSGIGVFHGLNVSTILHKWKSLFGSANL